MFTAYIVVAVVLAAQLTFSATDRLRPLPKGRHQHDQGKVCPNHG